MSIYDLIECNDNCSRTSTLANSVSLKSKMKITGKSPDDGNAKNVEIAVPLKYLSNFWRTLEMVLINCKTNLFLKMVLNLRYDQFNRQRSLENNKHKTLCSGCNFINSR